VALVDSGIDAIVVAGGASDGIPFSNELIVQMSAEGFE